MTDFKAQNSARFNLLLFTKELKNNAKKLHTKRIKIF